MQDQNTISNDYINADFSICKRITRNAESMNVSTCPHKEAHKANDVLTCNN